MNLIVRSLLILAGMIFCVIGGSFLAYPASPGGSFGLDTNGAQGLSSLRGDFTAYFWVTGGGLIYGAWAKRRDVLLIPGLLLGITFAARALSLALDGFYENWWQPMGVEALTIVLILVGRRAFAQRGLSTLGSTLS